jgi:large subunit ribosomal protein L16
MGKGKGSVDHWITKIHTGSVIVELKVNSPLLAKAALTSISKKLPFKTTFISTL